MRNRKWRLGILAACTALLSLTAVAAEGYVCVANHAAGMAFDKNKKGWNATTFKPAGKYLVTKAKPGDTITNGVWVVKYVGTDGPAYSCADDFDKEYGTLLCRGIGEFRFNRKTNRFLSSYMLGYYSDDSVKGSTLFAEGSQNPSIEIGTCSPL